MRRFLRSAIVGPLFESSSFLVDLTGRAEQPVLLPVHRSIGHGRFVSRADSSRYSAIDARCPRRRAWHRPCSAAASGADSRGTQARLAQCTPILSAIHAFGPRPRIRSGARHRRTDLHASVSSPLSHVRAAHLRVPRALCRSRCWMRSTNSAGVWLSNSCIRPR